jgi:glycosyltransferase involved in cell wall biosynthesis
LMPLFNAEATAEAAIQSIVEQTYTDWELLAVDDGSTDGTLDLLSAWATRDKRIRVCRRPHGGIVSTLNAGLELATGTFIARMDADDVPLTDRFEKQLDFLNRHPDIGVVGCRVTFGGDASSGAGYATHVDWVNALINPEDLSLNRFVEAPVAHPSVLFRADLPRRYGGYRDGDFPEDYEPWLRWMDAGVRLGKLPEPLLIWKDPPTRLSRNHARYSVDAFYRLKAPGLPAGWPVRIATIRGLLSLGAGESRADASSCSRSTASRSPLLST